LGQHEPEVLKPRKIPLLDANGEKIKVKGRLAYQLGPDGQPIEVSPLSTRKSSSVPSWLFERAITTNNADRADYAEHIRMLKQTVDPKLYIREYGTCGPDARARYGEEIYAVAVGFSRARRAATRAATETDINHAFPRVPVCRLPGGTCAFRGPCMQDGEHARASFELRAKQHWTAR
jgi:hypothetical protein